MDRPPLAAAVQARLPRGIPSPNLIQQEGAVYSDSSACWQQQIIVPNIPLPAVSAPLLWEQSIQDAENVPAASRGQSLTGSRDSLLEGH